MKRLPIFLIIFLIISICLPSAVFAWDVPEWLEWLLGDDDYHIEGNSVYINDSNVYIECTPHTLTASGWVDVKFWTKKYSGDIDLVAGFNGLDGVEVQEVEIWKNNKWNNPQKKIKEAEANYAECNKWQTLNTNYIESNTIYHARLWIDIPFDGVDDVSGKYTVGLKPTNKDIEKAWILDPWYSSSWNYRQCFTVENLNGGDLTNFQLPLEVYASTGSSSGNQTYLNYECQADFDDVRFTNSDGQTEIDFWRERYTSNTSAIFWVEFDTLTASSNTTFYIYYDNPAATYPTSANTTQQGDDTFRLFDDFERGNNGDEVGHGWTESSGTVEISTTQDIGDVAGEYGTRSMGLLDDGTNSSATIDQVAGNDYSIRYWIWKSDASRHIIYHGDGSNLIYVRIDTDEDIEYYDGVFNLVGSITADSWQLLEFKDIDFTNATYDIYLNDIQLVNDAPMNAGASNNNRINLQQVIVTEYTYIDNFFVTSYNGTMPDYNSWCAEEEYSSPYPTITTNPANNVEETTATLNGTINTGTSITMRGFAWGTTSNTTNPVNEEPPASYTDNWTEQGSFSTGLFSHGATGLTTAELYYYRAYSYNATGYGWATNEEAFFTKPLAPTNLVCTPGDGQMDLTWTKATGGAGTTVYTYIRYKAGSYPANIADGTLSYNGTGNSNNQGGLVNGTDYYFRAWSWAVDDGYDEWSDNYDGCHDIPAAASVITLPCTGFKQTWAIVNGYLENAPMAGCTQYGFDYGTTISYGSESTVTAACAEGDTFKITLTSLTPATLYHYRAKVFDGVSWYYGQDKVFATKGSPALYEYWDTGGDGDSQQIYGANWTYQTFTTNTTDVAHSITSIWLSLQRVGSPSDVTVSVRHTDGSSVASCSDNVTGADIINATLDGDSFGTEYTWYEFEFDDEICFEEDTVYAIVVRAINGDSSNYVLWQWDSGGGYDGGNAGHSNDSGSTWTDDCPADFLFQIWGNPCLNMEDAKVFNSYVNDGDWLITCLYLNTYPPYYEDGDDVSSLFYIQLTDGTNVLASTKCPEWGYRPAAIYLSEDMVSSLEWGENYYVRVWGNFGDNPYMEYILQDSDWMGDDLKRLDSWVRSTASLMETYYAVTLTEYIAGKGIVLNEDGGVIFANNIPELDNIRSDIFEIISEDYGFSEGEYTHDYADSLVWQTFMGSQLSTALTRVGNVLNVEGATAGVMITFLIYALIALLCFAPGHAIAAILIPSPIIYFMWGTGLAELALMGIFMVICILLLIWQFVWKGGA